MIKKDNKNRVLIVAGSLIITVFSVFYFVSAPKWMSQVNNYQAIFYGILKDSPTPENDLKQLGIPEKYLPLANTHGFLDHGQFDIYSDEFQKEVYDKAPFTGVLKFYLLNPDRFIDKLILSAHNSVLIRPSYLGNYSEEDVSERLSFTDRFSFWSNLRKHTLGYAFYIITVYSILYFTINMVEIINSYRNDDDYKLTYSLSSMLLFLTAMSQFVLPVIGNGEADLQKHMLLFNICFDLMILVGTSWLMENYNNKLILKMLPVALASFVLIYIIIPQRTVASTNMQIETGDYIQLGSYKSNTLKWIVLNYNENGYLLWCEHTVDYMEFDLNDESISGENYGSNNWESSDIRFWLNNDFKYEFTEHEQKLINNVSLKNVLNHNNLENRTGGNKPYYWTAITSYVDENYDNDAYFSYLDEEIFLLDSYQLKNYIYNNKIEIKKHAFEEKEPIRYWLRTPYYSSISMVRVVDKDGFVYHKDANVKAGVVPAVYIKDDLYILAGNGTKDSPYVISIKE